MSANKSLKKKNFPLGWKCYKTIGSYISCVFIEIWSTWEVWRVLKKLELLSAMPQAILTHLSCSPNFLHASYLNEHTLTYEPIVKWGTCVNEQFFYELNHSLPSFFFVFLQSMILISEPSICVCFQCTFSLLQS